MFSNNDCSSINDNTNSAKCIIHKTVDRTPVNANQCQQYHKHRPRVHQWRPSTSWMSSLLQFVFFFTSWLTVDNSSRILLSACPSSFLFPSCSFFPCQPSLRWIITVQWHELKNIQLLKQRKPGQREREAKSISSTGVDQVQDTLIVLPF